MSDPLNKLFPQGTNGVDLGETVLLVANDKLVAISKAAREHFTLHFGSNSQVLDIHKTCTAADGSVTHKTLFTISHESLGAMLQEIAQPALRTLRGVVRPLRPGWMVKNNIGAIVGLTPTEPEIHKVAKVRHRKLIFDQEKLAAQAWAPEFIDELYDLADGQTFTLFSFKDASKPHRIGIAFKFTDAKGRRRLVWLRDRRVADALKRIDPVLRDAAIKHGTFHELLPWF